MTISTASFDTSSYIFECCCCERFNNVAAASVCKKCRNYSVWGYTKYVIDTTTGEVVHGSIPTVPEYEAQAKLAEACWAEEKAEAEFHMQMYRQEGPLFDAEMQRQEDEAAKVAAAAEEDRLYALQDRMLGIM